MIHFTLNGKEIAADCHPGMTLFDYLRENEVFSVKYGSDFGETGADAVLIDDRVFNASMVLMHTVNGKSVETAESFASGNQIHPLQNLFIEEGAIQCGYCTPGMILAIESLIRIGKHVTEQDVREALAGVYCRCTGYVKPLKAAMKYLSANGS